MHLYFLNMNFECFEQNNVTFKKSN